MFLLDVRSTSVDPASGERVCLDWQPYKCSGAGELLFQQDAGKALCNRPVPAYRWEVHAENVPETIPGIEDLIAHWKERLGDSLTPEVDPLVEVAPLTAATAVSRQQQQQQWHKTMAIEYHRYL